MTQPQVFRELEHVRFSLWGDLPCKKNRRIGTGRNSHYPPTVQATLRNLELQARGAWGCRKPVVSPDIEVFLYVASLSKDYDGIVTSVWDCLKKARVIVDDSLRYLNGTYLQHPAVQVSAREERIEIVLEFPKGAANP